MSSNFIAVFLLTGIGFFFFHLSGSERKHCDTGAGTKTGPQQDWPGVSGIAASAKRGWS
jgi:hypothetical protein